MLDLAATCLAITALLAYVNHRFVGLPTTIGVMITALGLSLLLLVLDSFGLAQSLHAGEERLLRSIDFGEVLLQGMLSLLLFAAALHVNLQDLKAYAWQIGGLALLGTIASTAVVGVGMWLVLPVLGVALPLVDCLLFGALISPTDPIAVIGILKSAGAPKNVETVISGESLFNDGVGVVLFSTIAAIAAGHAVPTLTEGLHTLLYEAVGGVGFGWVLGYATFRLLKSIDHYQVEVLLTLAAVIAGYALAGHLHVSGPLAMVVAGVIVGNRARADAMSDTTRRYVDMFWELIDEILNAILFVLIGMEIVLIALPRHLLLAGAAAVVVTLLARLLAVGLPVLLLDRHFKLPLRSWQVLTWGGLRGGISVALALSLPQDPTRDIVVALTYCVVVFSIVVQGLTVSALVRRTIGLSPATIKASGPA